MREGSVVKAAMCRLLLAVYVDRDPFRVVSLPRAYRDLASSSDATAATADTYSGVFPCSSNASDLADVCAYTCSYIASVRGPTKLWKVRVGTSGSFGLNVEAVDGYPLTSICKLRQGYALHQFP